MVYAAIVFPPPLNIAMSNFHHRRTLLPPPNPPCLLRYRPFSTGLLIYRKGVSVLVSVSVVIVVVVVVAYIMF